MNALDSVSRKILIASYLILLGLIIFTCSVGFIFPDIWWQLREGINILYNWKLPQIPLHAFGIPHTPFPHEYTFYEILIASIHRLFGFFGLRIFFFTVAIFPFAYAFSWIAKKRQWNFANFYLLSFAYFLLVFRVQQRPEILANVFLILTLHLLLVRDFRASPYFILIFLWANTHASFILGLGAIVLWAVNDIALHKRKNIFQLSKIGLAGLAGSVLNPSGVAYLFEPLKLQSAAWSKLVSSEMLPASVWNYPFILIAIVLAITVIYKTGWKQQFWILALLAVFIFLSFQSKRYINLLGCLLCFLVFVNARAGDKFTGAKKIADFALTTFIVTPCLLFLAIFLLPMLSRNSFKKEYTQRFAAPILRALPDENKKILVEIRCGAYINGITENLKTLLDTGFNRFHQDTIRYFYYLDNIPEALYQALDQLQVDYVIVNKVDQYWNFVLSEHPRWKLTQIEPQSVLYTQRDELEVNDPKRIVLWDSQELEFYEPASSLVQETLKNINSNALWHEARFYPFFRWWLKRQNPSELEIFLQNTATLQPTLELVLQEELKQLELSKLSEKKYDSTDSFDHFIKAQIFFQHGNSENARKELQGIRQKTVFLSWKAEIIQGVYSESKFDHLIWNELNQKWFSDFTEQLNAVRE